MRDRASGPFGDGAGPARARHLQQRPQAVDEALAFVGEEQRLHFVSERPVASAAPVEQRPALVDGTVDGIGEHLLNLLPASGRPRVVRLCRSAHVCSSRFNHARAVDHSLLMVAGDTSSVLGGLFHGHPAVEAAFDDARLALAQRAESHQRVVQCEKLVAAGLGDRPHVVFQGQRHVTAAALLPPARDRVINQDAAHRLRGHRQVVRPVVPFDPIELAELEPRFVHERRRAQGVSGALVAQLASGDPAQLLVHERNQLSRHGDSLPGHGHGPAFVTGDDSRI